MDRSLMKKSVLDYINKNDQVSYAELQWLFENNGYDYKGDLLACSDICEHVVFWCGWNQDALDILGELIQEKKIHREPASTLIYYIDGACLPLPLVKKKTEYKTDHWLPAVFCSGSEQL